MTITMPEGLQELSNVIVGTDFPEGDEDALRRLGEAWATCAGEVDSVLGDVEAAIKDVLSTMEGRTAEAFKEYGDSLLRGDEAPLPGLKKACEQLGEACDNVALEVEYTKISIITALSLLLAQIASMLALAAVTFGASTAGIPAATATTQAVARGFLQALWEGVKQVLLQMAKQLPGQLVFNLGVNHGIDAGIQLGQMGAGNRKDWDESKTGAAALSGVAGGLGGALAGGAFGGIAKNFGGKFSNAFKSSGDKDPAAPTPPGGKQSDKSGWAEAMGYGMAGGTAGGTIGGALNNEFQGEEHNEQNMGSAALGGAIGGGLGVGGSYKSGLESNPGSGLDSISGQDTTFNAPDPSTSSGGSTLGPGSNTTHDNQSEPDPSTTWQEWDSAPPIDPDHTPSQSNQSEPDPSTTDNTPAQTPPPNPSGGEQGLPWYGAVSELPLHMVNFPEDTYSEQLPEGIEHRHADRDGAELPDR